MYYVSADYFCSNVIPGFFFFSSYFIEQSYLKQKSIMWDIYIPLVIKSKGKLLLLFSEFLCILPYGISKRHD